MDDIKEDGIIKETIIETKIRQFKQLSDFLEHWYYKPDIDALKIILSTYVAHTYLSDDPVWLFIVGSSGSGKTSIAIKSLSFLPNTHTLAELGVNSFLSGFGENNGILGRLKRKHNSNGIFLFPDFSSVLSKRLDVRNEIVGQLRLIYDGNFAKEVGNKGEIIEWKGKVSCLAAVTPAIEDYWGANRVLGERFMYVRWLSGDGKETAKFAARQVGKRDVIEEEFKRKILEYVDVDSLKAVIINYEENQWLASLSSMVARLRVIVKREESNKGRKAITGISEPEIPTRIMKVLNMIARGSATLDRRAKIDINDLELAKRVALDSIPYNRHKIIKTLVDETLDYKMNLAELKGRTGLSRWAISRTVEELLAMSILDITEEDGNGNRMVILKEDIIEQWEESIVSNVNLNLDIS